MKPNQDPSDLLKELAPLEHAYSGAHANMEENYVIGSVFETATEKYHTFFTWTAATHVRGMELDHLENACTSCRVKMVGSLVE